MRTPLKLLLLAPAFLILAAPSHPETACTMDAKLCPDGETYVGRDGNNNCEWEKCPGEEEINCAPYVCANGKTHPRCSEDGHVINYFAAPCHMDGGEEGAPFEDVTSDHPNADAIFYVKSEGIVEGYADGTYRPDATINRAEFVKILVGALDGDHAVCKIAPFADVDQSAWYSTSAHKARCYGLVEGYPDGTFRPANSINFVEAAKILGKTYSLESTTTIPACEGDCPWYRDYVLMLEMKAAIPTSITRFDQNITRGEMAEMIWRLKTGNMDKPSRTYEGLEEGSAMIKITLYFGVSAPECAEVSPTERMIPKTAAVADAALRALLAGVTPEEKARGLRSSFFGPSGLSVQDSLLAYYRGVSVENGIASVQFSQGGDDYLNSPACQSATIMNAISRTLRQFSTITQVRYLIDGVEKTVWDA